MQNLNPFSFKGTLSQKGYAATVAALLVLGILLQYLEESLGGNLPGLVCGVVLLYCGWAASEKRCRDAGVNPAQSLLFFVPVLGLLWVIRMIFRKTPGLKSEA